MEDDGKNMVVQEEAKDVERLQETHNKCLFARMSKISEEVNAEIASIYQQFGTVDESKLVGLVRDVEQANHVFSLPVDRKIIREEPTMRNFIRIETSYTFIDLDTDKRVSLVSYGDGVDGAKVRASSQAMRNADINALCEAYKIVLPEVKVASEKKKSEPKPRGVQKATPEQVKMLADFYTGAKLTKLLQINKISRIEDIPMAKATELISKIYKV